MDFPRDTAALTSASTYWSHVHRRGLLRAAFVLPAFAAPVTRRSSVPADAPFEHKGAVRVGRSEIDGLWKAAADAQTWDSKFGGGDWRTSSVLKCLHDAAPLLHGTYSEATGRQLFAATAELSRVAGWAAFDAGHHGPAQRLFIQGLRMARAAGDVQAGAYVLATMSLQAYLRGHTAQAVDMAEAAFYRGRHAAAPRVLAFAKLAEAPARARAGDGRAATTALGRCEDLLDLARRGGHDPAWISYMSLERLATDAEVHRDIGATRTALAWADRAEPMLAGRFTRATGIRYAVLAGTHALDRDLDQALRMGHRSVDVLSQLSSPRAHSYLHDLVSRLVPWQGNEGVRVLAQRVRTELEPAHPARAAARP